MDLDREILLDGHKKILLTHNLKTALDRRTRSVRLEW
jgi:hypothetical protein